MLAARLCRTGNGAGDVGVPRSVPSAGRKQTAGSCIPSSSTMKSTSGWFESNLDFPAPQFPVLPEVTAPRALHLRVIDHHQHAGRHPHQAVIMESLLPDLDQSLLCADGLLGCHL